jgi:Ca2+:H+ antiporter
LLNATFGNATELIIAVFTIQAGLFEVVKASITGAIIGNVLLITGCAMFFGGLKREKTVL